MTGRDWDLRGARLLGLQFTQWLVDNNRYQNFIDEYQIDNEQAWAAAEASGWVETVRPTRNDACRPGFRGYDPWPQVTGAGRLEVDRIRGLRTSPLARVAGCREALLLWLAHEGQGAASVHRLLNNDIAKFYDTPFTVDEVNRAAKFLVETELITGWPYSDGTLMSPALTAAGTRCVEFHDANIRDFLFPSPGGPMNQQNFYGDFHGQNAQGDNNTQIQNTGIDAAALGQIFAAMREALSTIDDAGDRDDVEHGIQQLEAAAQRGDAEEVQASAGRLKRLGDRIGNAAVTAATTVGIKELLELLNMG